jgi:hypothetical protein
MPRKCKAKWWYSATYSWKHDRRFHWPFPTDVVVSRTTVLPYPSNKSPLHLWTVWSASRPDLLIPRKESLLCYPRQHNCPNIYQPPSNSKHMKGDMKFHTEDPQTWGATVQKIVAQTTWCSWFVHTYCYLLNRRLRVLPLAGNPDPRRLAQFTPTKIITLNTGEYASKTAFRVWEHFQQNVWVRCPLLTDISSTKRYGLCNRPPPTTK